MKRLAFALLAAALASPLSAQEAKPAAPAATKASYLSLTMRYPLDTCIVSGEELDDDAEVFEIEGRELRTCCGKCKKKVEAQPEKYLAKVDEKLIAAQKAAYPLDTCPVSGKKIGSMGDGHEMVLAGTLVRLCCDHCVGKATKNAAKIVADVKNAAYEKQKAAYSTAKCVVSGHDIDPAEATDVMYGTTLVRLCCEDCVDELKEQPDKFLTKLTPSAKPTKGEDQPVEPAKKKGD